MEQNFRAVIWELRYISAPGTFSTSILCFTLNYSRRSNTDSEIVTNRNVDLINQTLLFEVSRRMPKGAHLHIHWNSCLPARFLIEQARNVDAMYIRSTLPLTTPENMTKSRISFMVLTPQEAAPLDNVWDAKYQSNRWMPYKQFQQLFDIEDENGTTLTGTSGAETWLESKMIIHEDEAYSVHQTGRGIWEKFNHRTQMMKASRKTNGNIPFFILELFLKEQSLTIPFSRGYLPMNPPFATTLASVFVIL
jgi:hypothetical protein